jgi:hypothetical protein
VVGVIARLFVTVTNAQEKQFNRQRIYFGFIISVHSHLTPEFLGCGEAGHHGRGMWEFRAAHLMVTRKQREDEIELEGFLFLLILFYPSH